MTAEEFGGNLWGERMADLAERREQAYRDYVDWVETGKDMLDRALSDLDQEHESLVGLRDDQIVLVRKTAGPEVRKYHSDDRPCGRVTGQGRSRSSFKTVLEGEAKRQGLKRCSACRWRSARSATESA